MKRLILFIVFTILITAPSWWMIRQHNAGTYTALMMWSPAMAAAIAVRLTGGNVSELGWRGVRWKWIAGAWAVTFGALVLAHIPVFAANTVHFPDPAAIADRAVSLGIANAPSALVILLYGVVVATSGMIRLAGPALGEELGWRGMAVVSACDTFGFAAGSTVTGIIWAAWHFPLMVGRVSPIGITNFTLMIIGMSFSHSWFRLRSGSIWPTTVMHALHNALVPSFFVKLSTAGPAADRWLDETGYALAGMGILLVALFVVVERRWPIPSASR